MKYAPLFSVIGYIAFTFAIILFGPIIYFGFDPLLTGAYLFCVVSMMTIGYMLGNKTYARLVETNRVQRGKPFNVAPILYVCLALSLGGLTVSVVQAVMSGTLNLSASEIGQSYVDSYQNYDRNTGSYSLTFLIYSATLPPTFIASVWGIYFYKRLSTFAKAATLLMIVGNLLFYTVGSGKQKQLGDTLIYLIAVSGIWYARSGRKVNLKVLLPSILIVPFALAAFVSILGQRYAAISIDAFNINLKTNQLQQFDLDHPAFKIFGYDGGFGLAVFSGYLSQGYFGLSLALQSSTTWSYMIGFSYSLMVLANRFLGAPWMMDRTYPYIVGQQTGWDETKWHSVFPHWASDFTFTGTVFLFGFFAFVFARTWRESVESENPFAILLFVLFVFGALFIPANNQLFISPGSLANVVIVTILYLTFHWRFNSGAKVAANR